MHERREREGERGVVHTIWNSNTHIHGAGEQISHTARTKKKFFFWLESRGLVVSGGQVASMERTLRQITLKKRE